MADPRVAYNSRVEQHRPREFPMLQDDVYLDHAGTTLYPKSLMDRFVQDMTSTLYGNPHSASTSSQRSTVCIDHVRHAALQFFGADPTQFDLVFVANATAGIKLVADAFRSMPEGFRYLYHQASHTSLVGVRQEAVASQCLSDHDTEAWINGSPIGGDSYQEDRPTLFAYPAQSNMDGRRYSLEWSKNVRACAQKRGSRVFTLLDAAALVATSPLSLHDASTAPDFVVLSFNKIFGFPNLGALVVRRQASSCFQHRNYFGGGTVDMVVSIGEQWHIRKSRALHEALEDGTLPIYNILALGHAFRIHSELFGSMEEVAQHTGFLWHRLSHSLKALRHGGSGAPVCTIYSPTAACEDPVSSGPTVAFNVLDPTGAWVSIAEFEKLATLKRFHVRTGGLCNPGGIAAALHLQPWEMKANFSAGFRCDNGNDIMNEKPTGVIRISLGAMSTIADVDRFVDFIREFYVASEATESMQSDPLSLPSPSSSNLYVDQLVVYPIKSCAGFRIPRGISWEVRPEGLAWDREWCLVHLGTGQALSQKRYPRMALIRPLIELDQGELRIAYENHKGTNASREICLPLSADPTLFRTFSAGCDMPSRVCGEDVVAQTYASDEINNFFSDILGTPCALARFPAGGSGQSMRHAKAHLQKHQKPSLCETKNQPVEGRPIGVATPPDSDTEPDKPRILLSNESPILAISLASLQALNDEIARSGRGSPVSAEVFRANVIIGSGSNSGARLLPYAEDHWSTISIGSQLYRMLGSCRRCHMVCINQDTGEKSEEPFVTLAKTRKFDGKVFFGTHMCHVSQPDVPGPNQVIQIGDQVTIKT